MTDTRSLLDKVVIMEATGTDLSELISPFNNGENLKENSLTINSVSGQTGYQGKINFTNLKEVEENFQDPKTKENYPFAYAKGVAVNGEERTTYNFQQMAFVSERDGKTKLVGNYFKYNETTDSPSLFTTNGTTGTNVPEDYYTNDDENQIYDFEKKDPPTTCPGGYYLPNGGTKCITVGKGYYSPDLELSRTKCEGNKTTPTNTSTNINDCSECINGYTGTNCETEITTGTCETYTPGNGIFTTNNPTNANTEWQTTTSTNPCYVQCDQDYQFNTTTKTCETITYNNCPGNHTTQEGFTITNETNHNSTTTGTKTESITNGTKTTTQDYICKNGTYTKQGTETETISCETNYIPNNDQCVADNCSGTLPDNAELNGYQGTGVWGYSEAEGLCKFKCQTGYSYKSNSNECVETTKQANCTGTLPSNTEANNGTQYTQTFNETTNVYEPATKAWTYNATGGECTYKCTTGNVWNGTSCISNTKTYTCTGLPANAVWSYTNTTTQTVTQTTINGTAWTPTDTSLAAAYNETGTATTCRYKCTGNFTGAGCTTCKAGYTGVTCNDVVTWTDPITGFVWEATPSTSTFKWATNTSYAEPTWNSTSKAYTSTSAIVDSTNYPAFARCTSLGTGWRLPTKHELTTLVNYTKYNPATDHPSLAYTNYWSSAEYANSTNNAWYVYFGDGYTFNNPKTDTYYVVCIHDDSVTATGLGRITNPDESAATRLGTAVTYAGISAYQDTYLNNKYWQASPDTTYRTWDDAIAYCAGLGNKTWRLPTIEELYSLTTYTATNSNSAYSVHPSLATTACWSSTDVASNTNYAWFVYFNYGNTSYTSKTGARYVVCIHD